MYCGVRIKTFIDRLRVRRSGQLDATAYPEIDTSFGHRPVWLIKIELAREAVVQRCRQHAAADEQLMRMYSPA